MMCLSSRCYISSFVEIGPSVPKKIFKGFTIYGHGGYLGHVTSIMSINFHFLVPISFLSNFGSDLHSSSCFNFCMYTTLGQGQEMTPRSRNDLDL